MLTSIADLKKQLNKPEEYDIKFFTNPANIKLLKEVLPNNTKEKNNERWLIPTSFHCLYGIPIIADKNMPQFVQRWEFPVSPFVEYEESDEVWAKPIGFGRYIDTDQPLFLKIHNSRVYGGFDPWKPLKYSNPIYSI